MKKHIASLNKARVLVIGDIMLDTYYEGDATRISPEAPVPVVKISKTRHILGGAGNVVNNIKSLGGHCAIISIIGKDWAGKRIKNILKENQIDTLLIESDERQTTIKSRIFARNQQMIRFDEENDCHTYQHEKQQIMNYIEKCIHQYSTIIISDYGKGFMYQELIYSIIDLAKKNNIEKPKIIIDPKPQNKSMYKNAFLLTPNTKEASELAQQSINSKEEIIQAATKLKNEFQADNILITLGEDGMLLLNNKNVLHIKSTAKQVFDVTGAGDTVIATLASAIALNIDIEIACEMATLAAGIVVEKVGSATANQEELIKTIEHTEIYIDNWL